MGQYHNKMDIPPENGRYLVKFKNMGLPEYDRIEIAIRDFLNGNWINPVYGYIGDGYELVGWYEN